jgi:hypothetical protein
VNGISQAAFFQKASDSGSDQPSAFSDQNAAERSDGGLERTLTADG